MGGSEAQCPGRDGRNLTAEDLSCPKCGYAVEFFSDERSRRCPGCGFRLGRAATSDCGTWCSAADQCALLREVGPGAQVASDD